MTATDTAARTAIAPATDDPDDSRCYWFIERPDRARRGGFAGLGRPLYPYPDRAYDPDPEVVAELDAGGGDRWWGPA